jgi:formate-dependent nitrite reductase cytochrome c552 subunit
MGKDKDKDLLEAQRFFDNFAEFVSDCSDQSTEELERELQQEGVDTDRLVQNVQSIVNAKIAEARLGWQEEAKLKTQQVMEKLAAIPERVADVLSRADLIKRIQSLIEIHGSQASLEYRNFQTMTDEDLQATLKDLEELIVLRDDQSSPNEKPER